MKRNISRTFLITIFMFLMFSFSCVFAADFGSWWNGASEWYKNGSTTVSVDQNVLSGISTLVEVVGTGVIAIVTVVLGMKYMLGSVQGKAEVKENLIGLVVACMFFFGWAGIRDMLITTNATAAGGLTGDTRLKIFDGDLESTISTIFTFCAILAKLICVAVIAYNGMKYILAGAEAKAQLKQKTPIMIIGVIMVFCTTTFIQFIVKAFVFK